MRARGSLTCDANQRLDQLANAWTRSEPMELRRPRQGTYAFPGERRRCLLSDRRVHKLPRLGKSAAIATGVFDASLEQLAIEYDEADQTHRPQLIG
jgi:hypothetical protein